MKMPCKLTLNDPLECKTALRGPPQKHIDHQLQYVGSRCTTNCHLWGPDVAADMALRLWIIGGRTKALEPSP